MRKLIVALLLALPAFVAGCNAAPETTAAGPAPPQATAPQTALASAEVTEVGFAQLDAALNERKGKVVVVDFWATWCGPCVKKFPHLVELHKKNKEKGLACVSVSMDLEGPKKAYDKEKVLAFLKEQDAAFANFIVADPRADDKKLFERFGRESGILPFMAVFGRDGKKVWDSEQKKLKDEELAKLVETELAK